MGAQVLVDLEAQVKRDTDVKKSAELLITGIATRIEAAVQAAIANGATAAELEPVTAYVTSLKDSSDALAAAVEANTPAA